LVNFKFTLSDKKGKSITRELKDSDANSLIGLQIGQQMDASVFGLKGNVMITGGSDKSGITMRSDVHGMPRKYILIAKGVGFKTTEKGLRKRKLVRGNTISEEIYQINCKYDGVINVEESKKEAPEKPKKEESKKEAPEKPKKEESKKEAPEKPKKEESKKEAP
ncbi:uncharacterized protein METZ01_LOCUS145340, partial [marine metagenome]